MAWNPIATVNSAINYRIVSAIEYLGIRVEIVGKLDGNGDPLIFKAFKFDYERDIMNAMPAEGLLPEKDIILFFFEAKAKDWLNEGDTFRLADLQTVAGTQFEQDLVYIIGGPIHYQFAENKCIYVAPPCYKAGIR